MTCSRRPRSPAWKTRRAPRSRSTPTCRAARSTRRPSSTRAGRPASRRAPKGATSRSSNRSTRSLRATLDVTPEDRILGCLPLFHTFGQTCVMNLGFRVGAAVVLVPKFDGATALALLNAHQCTIMTGVPTMYIALLEAAKSNPERPPLRYGMSGGAAIPVAVIERMKEVYGIDVHEGYGLTETSPVATFNHRGKPTRVGHGRPADLGRRRRDRRRGGRRPHRTAPARGARRDRRARAQPDEGVPAPAGGERRSRGRRLVPHRRPRDQERRRLRHDRRPQEGHDRAQRLQRVPARGRRGAVRRIRRSRWSPSSVSATRPTARRSWPS